MKFTFQNRCFTPLINGLTWLSNDFWGRRFGISLIPETHSQPFGAADAADHDDNPDSRWLPTTTVGGVAKSLNNLTPQGCHLEDLGLRSISKDSIKSQAWIFGDLRCVFCGTKKIGVKLEAPDLLGDLD